MLKGKILNVTNKNAIHVRVKQNFRQKNKLKLKQASQYHVEYLLPILSGYHADHTCQWLLESLDLGSLCWLIFGGKSTECGKFKPN